jgi:hypothetical protein
MVQHNNAICVHIHHSMHVRMCLSMMEPSHFAHKNARSLHEQNQPESASCNHPMLSTNTCHACSLPAMRRMQNMSTLHRNVGHSFRQGRNYCCHMKTGLDMPTCMPMPVTNCRYDRSKSCGHQPSKKVSSITTNSMKPATFTW